MNYLQAKRLDALARDYALGTLQGGARRRFERVLRESAAAAQALSAWQLQFDTLAGSVPPMAPRPAVWGRLQQRLFGTAAAATPWWKAPLSGRAIGGALAGLLLGAVVMRQQPAWVGLEAVQESLPASYVGLLTAADGKPGLLASSRRHGHVLTVKLLQPLAVPPGQTAQLWALPKDGSPPFAVGPVPARGSATIALSDSSEKLFFNVGRLAVSLEPAGAAAAAAPTAAYVLSGHCVKLW